MTSAAPHITEASTAQFCSLDEDSNVTDGLLSLVDRDPRRPVYAVPTGAGGWMDVTASRFLTRVRSVAHGLIGLGIAPGDRVAVMSPTCYSWAVIDQAVWFAGGISVPIYETSSVSQVVHILTDSGASLAMAGTEAIAETMERAVAEAGVEVPVHGIGDDLALAALAAQGRSVDDEQLESARTASGLDDVATLVYTSGTTGVPSGARITHRNLAEGGANIVEFAAEILGGPDSRTLLFLPLAHVLARAVQLMCLHAGVQVAHSPSTATLPEDLASFRPTWLLGVPRVFEKVYQGASAKAHAQRKGRIFDAARDTAVAYSRALDAAASGRGEGPSRMLRAKRAVFSRLVYSKLRAGLGGRAEFMISGASALDPEIAHFFTGAGVPVQEGYGLTESTAPATLNIPGSTRIGSVGLPVPGTTVRLAEDGEVLLRGPVIFDGYHAAEARTEAAFDRDGFFRTGDLGALDDDGFLTITGRKKELIVTGGGKNVHPTPLEELVRREPLVSQVIVVGDGQPFVGALVTLDPEALSAWSRLEGRAEMSLAEACVDDQVRAKIQQAVDAANATVSRAESVRRFTILDAELTEDSGHMTASMKLRRHQVLADFSSAVDGLYTR
ncbi:MAG: AMP-dependent synthetase/ligase [Nesterenkonia sp.]|nr:AMP-dependent synthetase/ligase [Nesterenkonia sp.]